MIAMAADEIVLEAHASLGPVDPQLGQYAAASLVAVAERPGDHDDETLIMADLGRKAIAQVEGFAERMLKRHMEPERAAEVARLLSTGTWTHDHPLQFADVQRLGLPARVGVPEAERELMTLYPQPRGRTPAVEYVPGPRAPSLPAGRRPQSGTRRGPA
jgi:ClpP class serine protease